jgi:hypothetical protein
MTHPIYLSQKFINKGTNVLYSQLLTASIAFSFLSFACISAAFGRTSGTVILMIIGVTIFVFGVPIADKKTHLFYQFKKRYLKRLKRYNDVIITAMKEVLENAEKEILLFNRDYKKTYFPKAVPEYSTNWDRFLTGADPIKQESVWAVDKYMDALAEIKQYLKFLNIYTEDVSQINVVELVKNLPAEVTEDHVIALGKVTQLVQIIREAKIKISTSLISEREPLAKEIEYALM